MGTPEVSVIIPVYNRASMLREAIASVLQQTDVSFELIVVDDGSTDSGCDGLEAWVNASTPASMTNFALLHRLKNRGVAHARNRGVAMASAPLIAFLDSDDLWAPAKLARQLAFMHSTPDCMITQTEEIWIRDGRRVNPGVRHRKRSGDIFLDSLRTCLISPSAVMMRGDLFRQIGGFDERMTAAEDYDLWLRILRHHEVGLLDEPLVRRRAGHRGQLSADTPAIDRFRILALLKLLYAFDLSPERRLATVEVLIEKCRIYGKGLHRRDDNASAEFILQVAKLAWEWVSEPDDSLTSATLRMSELLATTGENSRTESTAPLEVRA